MGGTDSRFFTSSFNIKSTGTPGVPLLKAELTKKRKKKKKDAGDEIKNVLSFHNYHVEFKSELGHILRTCVGCEF